MVHILCIVGGFVAGAIVVGFLVYLGTCAAIARGLNW